MAFFQGLFCSILSLPQFTHVTVRIGVLYVACYQFVDEISRLMYHSHVCVDPRALPQPLEYCRPSLPSPPQPTAATVAARIRAGEAAGLSRRDRRGVVVPAARRRLMVLARRRWVGLAGADAGYVARAPPAGRLERGPPPRPAPLAARVRAGETVGLLARPHCHPARSDRSSR